MHYVYTSVCPFRVQVGNVYTVFGIGAVCPPRPIYMPFVIMNVCVAMWLSVVKMSPFGAFFFSFLYFVHIVCVLRPKMLTHVSSFCASSSLLLDSFACWSPPVLSSPAILRYTRKLCIVYLCSYMRLHHDYYYHYYSTSYNFCFLILSFRWSEEHFSREKQNVISGFRFWLANFLLLHWNMFVWWKRLLRSRYCYDDCIGVLIKDHSAATVDGPGEPHRRNGRRVAFLCEYIFRLLLAFCVHSIHYNGIGNIPDSSTPHRSHTGGRLCVNMGKCSSEMKYGRSFLATTEQSFLWLYYEYIFPGRPSLDLDHLQSCRWCARSVIAVLLYIFIFLYFECVSTVYSSHFTQVRFEKSLHTSPT